MKYLPLPKFEKLLKNVQRYGEECPAGNTDESYMEAYRQGWSDAMEELKDQLTKLA